MNQYTYEAILAVRDYASFDDAQDAHVDAIKQVEAIAAELGITCKVDSVCFSDFDSSNPDHACAYFQVEYTASMEIPD